MWKCVHFIYMSCVFMKLHRRATRIQHMLSVPYASSQSHSDPAHVVSAIRFIAEPLGSSTLSVPYASSQSHSDPAHVVSAIRFCLWMLRTMHCCGSLGLLTELSASTLQGLCSIFNSSTVTRVPLYRDGAGVMIIHGWVCVSGCDDDADNNNNNKGCKKSAHSLMC